MKKYQLEYTGKFSELMVSLVKVTIPAALLLGVTLFFGGRGEEYSSVLRYTYDVWDTRFIGAGTYSFITLLIVIYNILVIWIFVKHFINSTAILTEEIKNS